MISNCLTGTTQLLSFEENIIVRSLRFIRMDFSARRHRGNFVLKLQKDIQNCFTDITITGSYVYLFQIIMLEDHQVMPLFKHLWVPKELLHLCVKF